SSVVLPTPLTPTRPARAPSSRTSERPSNRGAPSCALVRSVAFNMGILSGRGRHGEATRARDSAPQSTTPPHARPCSGFRETGRWLATSPPRRVEDAAMDVSWHDEHALGLSWGEGDGMRRASHALADGGRVWLVDPVDAGDALERAR